MPSISKVRLPDGNEYDMKDEELREILGTLFQDINNEDKQIVSDDQTNN